MPEITSAQNGSRPGSKVDDDTESISVATNGTESEQEVHSSCHNVKVFLALMCVFSVTQGFAINGINNVNIPMYEKRFELNSKQSGLVASFYDIAAGCTVLLAGYYGTQFHQPRFIGLASLSLALGSLSMALPHFTTGDYEPSGARKAVCYADGNSSADASCTAESEGLPNNLYILLLGQGLHGLAGTVLYGVAPAFIDGSVSAKQSPTYLAIFYGSSALGPAIGYLAGGKTLDIYVDTPKPPPQGLTSTSPAWVGAWWIGFLASFGCCLILALPLCTFPRVLPGTERRRKNNVSQAHDHGSQHKADQSGFGMSIRDMPVALLLLLKNPVFVCQCIIGSVEGFIVSGLSTFLPKFIANQFNQTASWSALVTGFMAVPGAAFGQFLGGFLVQRYKMKIRDMLKFNMGCSVGVLILAAVFWAKCDQSDIVGVNRSYDDRTEMTDVNLIGSCNSGCGCDTSVYEPVCLQDVEYFTACHAGCSNVGEERKKSEGGGTELVYEGCNCTLNRNDSLVYMAPDGMKNASNDEVAIGGKCGANCIMLYVFIPAAFGVFICTFMMPVPGTTIILRSVNDKQRTFALSIQQMCMRFIGTIPGPLVFGDILDNVCRVWQSKCDDTQGSCWIYDKAEMSKRFYIVVLCIKLTTLTLLVIALCLYKPPKAVPVPPISTSTDLNSNDIGKSTETIETQL